MDAVAPGGGGVGAWTLRELIQQRPGSRHARHAAASPAAAAAARLVFSPGDMHQDNLRLATDHREALGQSLARPAAARQQAQGALVCDMYAVDVEFAGQRSAASDFAWFFFMQQLQSSINQRGAGKAGEGRRRGEGAAQGRTRPAWYFGVV